TLAVFDPVCLNDTAFLLTGGEPLNGTYFGSGTDTAGYFHPDIAGAGQHAVSYVYTDSIGCRDTAQQVLFVDALPVVTLGELSSMCMNAAPVTLTQGSPPGGYYTVNDTDTVSLFNPILTGAGMHTIAYIYTAPGGCTDTASDTITVFGLPVVSLDSIPDVCITLTPFHLTYSPADSGIFSGQGTDSTGMFNPENAGLGIHTIIYSYTDTNLCSNSDTQTVSVLTGPNVIPEVTDLLCTNSENGSVSLTISGGLEPYSFIWAHSSDTNRNLTNLAAGIYTVTVTDSSGCSTVGNISVGIVNDLTAFAGADVISCPGDTIQLSDSAYIADSVIYTWYPVTGLSDPDILTPLATPEVTTSYILSVEDTMCSVTDTVTITVVQPPVIEAGDDLILFPGTELILQFTVTDSIVSCIWSPADRLSNEYARNPVVSTAFQTEDETILFHVTGTSLDGCISKDSVCVRIVGFYIPKGFTPNGDGVNDLWVTDFLDRYPGAVIEVFNRWGEKLFEGGPGEDYWDGTRNGKPVPSGTYYYIVTVPEEVTAIFRRSGSVTILR
ncbi:MAG: gliding motility-associated C-terminal domain-containing protein, partial [Bacteroidetes bacterium]|nr:gliding motility-associated C-terminal domain-containing protein [Bacteroidota bacterium]